MRRAREAAAAADLVLLVMDASRDPEQVEPDARERAKAEGRMSTTVVVLNKSDLPGALDAPLPCPGALRVSALTGLGLGELKSALLARLVGTGPIEEPVLTDARHAGALEAAAGALDSAARAEAEGLSEELLLEDLNDALRRLGELTGDPGHDDLYERIFSTFCIGK